MRRFGQRGAAAGFGSLALGQRVHLGALVSGVIGFCLSWQASEARAQSVADLEQRLSAISQSLVEVHQLYLAPAQLEAEFKLEARLQEGQVLLDAGDAERACVMFLDIVIRDEWRGHPGYQEALVLLAQSLYQAGYDSSARDWALLVLEQGRAEDQQTAISLLIEIGIKTGNWSGVDEIFAKLERTQSAQLAPELLYVRGKGLYVEGRYDEAEAMFLRIDPNSPAGLKGRYFLGVMSARRGDLDAAMGHFDSIVAVRTNDDPVLVDLVELAYLAEARIYYERQDWVAAIDTYQNIPRTSRHFDQALYEITWTHIRQGEPKLALRNLEILIISKPESVFIPDAQRLIADLLKDLGEFEKALDTYETILEEFEPVLIELEAMVRGEGDRLRFFQQLVAQDESGNARYLPASATQWVRPDEHMGKASEMVGSLGQSFENTTESEVLIEEIEAAISGPNRYEFYADLRGAWVAGLELEASLLAVHRDMNAVLVEQRGSVPATAEREEEQRQFAALPSSREEFMLREKVMGDALEERKLRLFRLKNTIGAMDSRIDAIRRWYVVEGERSAALSDELRVELDGELAQLELEVEALRKEYKGAERELRVLSSVGSDGSLVSEESEIRKRYELALKREKEALLASGGDGDASRVYATIDRLDGELESYRGQVIALVDQRVSDVRRRLDAETALLEQSKVRYDQLQGDVELVAGEIAYQHWQRAQTLFTDLVLGAEIGLVDVSWLRKDRLSRRIDELIEERGHERSILEQDFRQIRVELGDEGASQ